METRQSERLITSAELAKQIGVCEATLRSWRRPGSTRGPKWIRLAGGPLIRYRASDVQTWLDQQYNRDQIDHVTGPAA